MRNKEIKEEKALNENKKPYAKYYMSPAGYEVEEIEVKLEAVKERTTKLDAIPITINYTLSVFTRYYKEADELVRNLIFNIINYPKIEVEIPYENTGRIHISNLRMGSDIVDNSAISERLSAGQFTIQSFSLNIDDAYLWDVRTKDNYFIDFDVEAKG